LHQQLLELPQLPQLVEHMQLQLQQLQLQAADLLHPVVVVDLVLAAEAADIND